MGFWSLGKSSTREEVREADFDEEKLLNGADSNEVVIPIHAKPRPIRHEEEKAEPKSEEKKCISYFRVSGIYNIGTETALSGIVEGGKIAKKMKVILGDKEAIVTDVKVGSTSVEELMTKEEGTVFVRGRNIYLIKYDDVLEFL